MKNHLMIGIILFLGVLLCVLVVFASNLGLSQAPSGSTGLLSSQLTDPTDAQPTDTQPTVPTTEPTVPTEPPIVKESTATIGATGDILFHDLVIASGYNQANGTYNYDEIYTFFSEYTSKVDYAVANLEVTLCSNDNGYAYKGYPCFNSPDAVAEALKTAGFDMLLTANNHAYDTGNVGFLRTQEVLDRLGMSHIGTRPNEQAKTYQVVEVNGIRIGMVNYTYNTKQDADGSVDLNGIPLSIADSKLVNSFNYYQLDSFYEKLQLQVDDMRNDGAEAIVIYIHWGDEYKTTQNSYQDKIAQQLCNMGIDVIVGNHAHVPQPVELLTNETDDTKKTLCLYSTGNAISNIYRGNFPVNTEDGMLFTFTFAKYSDGTVVVESAEILPTWVYRYYDENWTRKFKILTLDDAIEDWKTTLNVDDATLKECQDSYQRTMQIVGAGLEEANAYYAQNQAEVEALIGVTK